MSKTNITPMPCWAVVQIVQPTKTKGGIIIPDTGITGPAGAIANQDQRKARCFMIASSGYYVHQGLLVCMDIPVGAELQIQPCDPKRFIGMPEDHYIMHLSDVLGWMPATEADRAAAIEEASPNPRVLQ